MMNEYAHQAAKQTKGISQHLKIILSYLISYATILKDTNIQKIPTFIKIYENIQKSNNLNITAYPQHTTIYLYITLYISTHHSALSPPQSAISTGK